METYAEIIKKESAELREMAAKIRESLRVARFDMATKEVKNTRMRRSLRRELARILTAIRAKEMEL